MKQRNKYSINSSKIYWTEERINVQSNPMKYYIEDMLICSFNITQTPWKQNTISKNAFSSTIFRRSMVPQLIWTLSNIFLISRFQTTDSASSTYLPQHQILFQPAKVGGIYACKIHKDTALIIIRSYMIKTHQLYWSYKQPQIINNINDCW